MTPFPRGGKFTRLRNPSHRGLKETRGRSEVEGIKETRG